MICCVHDEDQGALQDLCKLISPQETAFVLLASDRGVWHCIRYCMTVPRHSRLRLLSFWGAVALGGFWWVLPKSVISPQSMSTCPAAWQHIVFDCFKYSDSGALPPTITGRLSELASDFYYAGLPKLPVFV